MHRSAIATEGLSRRFLTGWWLSRLLHSTRHGTQTNEIELQPGTAYTYQLYGIGDVQTDNVVNIKAGAYYVTFNLKTGFNREIDDGAEDYANQILIHEGLDIPFRQTLKDSYFDTKLVGNLQTIGDTFEVLLTKGYLKIRVCSIDTTGSNGAKLSIGLDNVGCHLDPGQVSSPIGVQTLQNRVPLTGLSGFRNDMFEYRLDLESLSEPVACHSWGGSGDIDMFLNFDSSPAITFVEGLNAVRNVASVFVNREIRAGMFSNAVSFRLPPSVHLRGTFYRRRLYHL